MSLKTLKPRLQTLAPNRVKTISANSWRGDKTTSERGYGHRWQKARLGHLRHNPLCVMCEAAGRFEAATVVDHIIPHRGDRDLFWNSANWQSLCATHHSSDKQRQEKSGARRVTFDANGVPVWD